MVHPFANSITNLLGSVLTFVAPDLTVVRRFTGHDLGTPCLFVDSVKQAFDFVGYLCVVETAFPQCSLLEDTEDRFPVCLWEGNRLH